MSTILDALRKLQRERSAPSPAKDLRGSITHEAAPRRARRRGAGTRGLAALLALLAVGGGGYVLYKSGQVQALLARFHSEASAGSEENLPSEEEFAAVEREEREREAAAAREPAPAQDEATPPAEQVAPAAPVRPLRQGRAPVTPPAGAATAPAETPEIAAERARLEAALANARAAQEAQRQAELGAAAQPVVPPPQPVPEPEEAASASASAPAPAPAPPPAKLVVAKRKPPTAAKPAAPVATAKPKPKPAPRAEAAAARPPTEPAADSAPLATAFPDVRVESIRWHPIPERRVASLRFAQQNAPEAREGDIVAGVLVYRINPGSVELRVGSAQRTVAPGP